MGGIQMNVGAARSLAGTIEKGRQATATGKGNVTSGKAAIAGNNWQGQAGDVARESLDKLNEALQKLEGSLSKGSSFMERSAFRFTEADQVMANTFK